MEKRVFFGALLLAVLLFGILFLTINKPEAEQTTQKAAQTVSEKIDQPSVQTASSEASGVDSSAAVQVNSVEETEESSGEKQQVDKIEKAPPAFGYMGKGAHLQIVGLMSKGDSEGPLKSYLDSLCQKLQCSVDVGYQQDITDAPWQQDVVTLLKLFASDGIEDGSLFVEANTLKIEGSVSQVKEAVEVQKILNRLMAEGLKVKNHIEMSEDAERKVKEIAATKVTKQDMSTAALSKKSETEPAHVVKKEPQTIEKIPAKKAQKPVMKSTHVMHKTHKDPHVSVTKERKPASSEKIAKKIKKSSKPKRSKIRRKPQKDIVAHSYMETSFDLTERIKAKTSDTIKERKSAKAKEDIVAKPKLDILK